MKNAETIEIVWVILTALALGWTIQLLHEARLDYLAIKKTGHRGLRWVIARASLRRELLRVTSQACLFFAGLVALARPTVECPPRDIFGLLVLFSFFAVALLLLLNTVLDARERHILRVSADSN